MTQRRYAGKESNKTHCKGFTTPSPACGRGPFLASLRKGEPFWLRGAADAAMKYEILIAILILLFIIEVVSA